MQFTQYDLGYLHGGETVEITLSGSAANVRLMDSSDLNSGTPRVPRRLDYVEATVSRTTS
jgi:hypothetical protein